MEATNKSLNIKEKLIAPKLLLLFFLSIAIFVCYALRDVAFMLVLSYMVAYIIDRALDFLKTKKIPRNIGVFMMVAILILLVVLFFLVLTPYFIKEISILQNKIPDIIKFFQNNFEKCIAYAQTKFPNFKVDDFSGEVADGTAVSVGADGKWQKATASTVPSKFVYEKDFNDNGHKIIMIRVESDAVTNA